MNDTSYKFGVMGCPIKHSLSPKMQQYWLKSLGIDGAYLAYETDGTEDGFARTISACLASGVSGLNVTIPHKLHAYALCDHLSDAAKMVQAVNTLSFGDGKIFGDNTDIFGFMQNLKQQNAYKKAFSTQNALIIGAGGTTRSVLFGLLYEGFTEIVLVNRTVEKAQVLKEHFVRFFPNALIEIYPLDQLQQCLEGQPEHSLIVNTSSIGMSDQGSWDIQFIKPFYVSDVVYAPIKTPFLQSAEQAGMDFQDGFGMLMYQGARAFTIWTGQSPTVDDRLRTYLLSD